MPARADRAGKTQHHFRAALAYHLTHRGQQAHLSPVSHLPVDAVFLIRIVDAERPHGRIRLDRGLQQTALERPDLAAVGRRAFRKEADAIAGQQGAFDVVDDPAGFVAFFALDEEGVGALGKKAEQRPLADFRFGDESGGVHAVERVDVHPRHVIGDEQRAAQTRGRPFAFDNDFDLQRIEQAGRPLLYYAVSPLRPLARQDEGGHYQAV